MLKPGLGMVLLVCVSASAMAQEGVGALPIGPPVEIKAIEGLAGSWDVDFRFRMSPDAPWQATKGQAEIEMVLYGAAQRMEFSGEMMGLPFMLTSLTCFDRTSGKWQVAWTDNLTARITLFEGAMTDGKLVADSVNKVGKTTVHSRNTMRSISDQSFELQLEQSNDGGTSYFAAAKASYKRRN